MNQPMTDAGYGWDDPQMRRQVAGWERGYLEPTTTGHTTWTASCTADDAMWR